ncbi:glycine betaine ABC transporter substrate-binding protein [Streptomyces gobiensis]|uniref:glycine betaine ABC transporter substrate-binding protein n=1 Tax=Streptomyces gobiensis TaxID=2875706 RepID=UPI001E422E35|nr:glycine betaine ABC transporter substrate-binding protein [Streptomyces gobiensis]UGY93236.1 glycine/betaine ABC transporter substrate-binding protein [Streptomyces gobiensis]
MRDSKRIRTTIGAGTAALGLLVLSACVSGGDGDDKNGAGYEEITIAVPSWAGAQANAAVAQHLLEKELNVRVRTEEMNAGDSWDGMNDGTVHAVLEDWRGEREREKKYIDDKKTVVEGGDLGVTGHIGWFVPRYYADENPEITDWKNLNKHAKDFKSEFLGPDKSFTSNDTHLIKNLELNLTIKPTKGEAGLLKEIEAKYAAREPFLTYWWEPHWKNLDLDLVEVKLPDYAEGCNKPKKFTDCAYANTPLQKYFNADFEENGGDAAEFLKNFRWSTQQQNEVAKMIEGDGLPPAEAAAKWTAANTDVWRKWLPKS